MGGKAVIIGTRHDHMADIWARYREASERTAINSLGWVADQWYESHNFRTLRPRTQKDYREVCSVKPIEAFRGWDVSQIEPSDVGQFLRVRAETSVRRSNLELVWLRHVLRYAVSLGVIPSDPCRDIAPLRDRPKKRQYVTDLSYWGMFAKAAPAVKVAMEISYCTGIRQGDVLKLRWEDIGDAIRIVEGKTEREYLKMISPRLGQALDSARKLPGQPFGGWVVRNRHGNQYTTSGFQSNWTKTKIQLPAHRQFRFHDIRHKAITDIQGQCNWWAHQDSNLGPMDYESSALTN